MGVEGFYPREYQYTGFELEEACIGHKINWKNTLKKQGLSEEELSYNRLFKVYQELYPLNPFLPEKTWARDLFDVVAEKLNIDVEDPKELKFINVLGTKLDRKGVDCFFSFKNPNTQKESYCTIDLTGSSDKDITRADILINESEDEIILNQKDKDYIEKLDKLAEKITTRLEEKTGPITH